jgi:hypothetical protein
VADEMMSSEYHTAGAENRGRASSCQGVSFVPSMSAYSAQLDLFVRTEDLRSSRFVVVGCVVD